MLETQLKHHPMRGGAFAVCLYPRRDMETIYLRFATLRFAVFFVAFLADFFAAFLAFFFVAILKVKLPDF